MPLDPLQELIADLRTRRIERESQPPLEEGDTDPDTELGEAEPEVDPNPTALSEDPRRSIDVDTEFFEDGPRRARSSHSRPSQGNQVSIAHLAHQGETLQEIRDSLRGIHAALLALRDLAVTAGWFIQVCTWVGGVVLGTAGFSAVAVLMTWFLFFREQ